MINFLFIGDKKISYSKKWFTRKFFVQYKALHPGVKLVIYLMKIYLYKTCIIYTIGRSQTRLMKLLINILNNLLKCVELTEADPINFFLCYTT